MLMLNNRVDLINNFFFFIEYVQLRTVVDRSYNKKVAIKSLEGDNFFIHHDYFSSHPHQQKLMLLYKLLYCYFQDGWINNHNFPKSCFIVSFTVRKNNSP